MLYQFQKLMRTVFRTNNIDCTSRWSTPFDALGPLMGFYTRAPLEEVIGKDCVLVVGGNVTEEKPVTEYLLRDSASAAPFAVAHALGAAIPSGRRCPSGCSRPAGR